MSQFECPVVKVEIRSHPDAKRIEIAQVEGFQSVVPKGQFKSGDLAVYIPEAAIVPDWMISEMGLIGKLSGPQKNRVKAIKLRGVLSQGLLYPITDYCNARTIYYDPDAFHPNAGAYTARFVVAVPVKGHEHLYPDETVIVECKEGDDMAEALGIVKYEPAIPMHLAGQIAGYEANAALRYDFDSIKKRLSLFDADEEVVMTEKIHGTFCMVGVLPESMTEEKNRQRYLRMEVDGMIVYGVVSSKGLAGKGLMLDVTDTNNLYVKHAVDIMPALAKAFTDSLCRDTPVFLMGEIYGSGVQDMDYGLKNQKTDFAAFDIHVGTHGPGYFLDYEDFLERSAAIGVRTVPELYRSMFDLHSVRVITDTPNSVVTLSNNAHQMPEGIVIRPVFERRDARGNRVIAKSVSERYLMRKNGTEYN